LRLKSRGVHQTQISVALKTNLGISDLAILALAVEVFTVFKSISVQITTSNLLRKNSV